MVNRNRAAFFCLQLFAENRVKAKSVRGAVVKESSGRERGTIRILAQKAPTFRRSLCVGNVKENEIKVGCAARNEFQAPNVRSLQSETTFSSSPRTIYELTQNSEGNDCDQRNEVHLCVWFRFL